MLHSFKIISCYISQKEEVARPKSMFSPFLHIVYCVSAPICCLDIVYMHLPYCNLHLFHHSGFTVCSRRTGVIGSSWWHFAAFGRPFGTKQCSANDFSSCSGYIFQWRLAPSSRWCVSWWCCMFLLRVWLHNKFRWMVQQQQRHLQRQLRQLFPRKKMKVNSKGVLFVLKLSPLFFYWIFAEN